MRRRLVLSPEISRAMGAFGLGRNALVMMLNVLREELENHADNYRNDRDSAAPEFYFWFELVVMDDGRQRRFRFTVDDTRATDHLFVVAAEEV